MGMASDDDVIGRSVQRPSRSSEGEARYERDGMTFDDDFLRRRPAGLLRASALQAEPCVLDFGGSGGSYYQCREFSSPRLQRWVVVEQPKFVRSARPISQ